jgi:hypothetical protein
MSAMGWTRMARFNIVRLEENPNGTGTSDDLKPRLSFVESDARRDPDSQP